MTIKECVSEILRTQPGLSHSEVAEKVRAQLNSTTSARNISWYISQLARTEMPELPISDEDLEIAESFNEPTKEEEIEYWQQSEKLVIRYENEKGASVEVVSLTQFPGYDLISTYPNGDVKRIAVKSKKLGKMSWLNLTSSETTAMLTDPHFWLYIVEGNIQDGHVKIVKIPRDQLLKEVKIKLRGRISNLSGYRRNNFSID